MNKSELIAEFINKLVAGETDAAKDAFSQFCTAKYKAISIKATPLVESFDQFKTLLVEFGNAGTAPISMVGNDIHINGKKVGHIVPPETNFEDEEAFNKQPGIDFVSVDGTFSKEFNTAKELFAFLSAKYLGEDNVE